MRSSWLLLGLLACGGSPKPAPAPPPPPKPLTDAESAQLACDTLRASDTRFRCAFLEKLGMTPAQCPDFLGGLLAEATNDGERAAFRGLMKDLGSAGTCDQVMTAFRTADAAARRSAASTP